MCNIYDNQKFNHGTNDYTIVWNQTGDNPATYVLTLRESMSGSEPEDVFTMALTGQRAHAFIENRKFREAVARELETAVKSGAIA